MSVNLGNVFACLRNISPPDYYCGTSGRSERWSVKDVIIDWVTIRNFTRHKDAERIADEIIKQIEKMETP